VHESYATAWEVAADIVPDADAIVHGDRRRPWRELDERAARFAGGLVAHGLGPGSQVALYSANCPEYLEANFGLMKLRAVGAPVNFRYRARELAYLLDHADAEAMVYERRFGEHVADAVPSVRRCSLLVEIDDGSTAPSIDGAVAFDDFVASAAPHPRVERSGEDLVLWYTGGTTGLPKGVAWHQQTLLNAGLALHCGVIGVDVPRDLDELAATIAALHTQHREPVVLATTPLVHATALHQANSGLLLGGRVVILERQPLDGDEVCTVIERERVTTVPVIGDVVGRRIVDALDRARAAGTPYDVSSVLRVHNSGAMASAEVKDALLAHGMHSFYDNLGSSEGTGYGTWLATKPGEGTTARFHPSATTKVLRADGSPASVGEAGLIATAGAVGVGYAKDPEGTAAVFRTIDGVRYAVNGDWARIERDGTMTLLGRGSGCINTGGEKVWPEEVEETLKQHPRVADAVVVGVPDATWGETVAALVSLTDGPRLVDGELSDWVAARLAAYKRPRRVVPVDEVRRTTVAKIDLEWARATLAAGDGSSSRESRSEVRAHE
jgi:fatty-acyl-CoA synthase